MKFAYSRQYMRICVPLSACAGCIVDNKICRVAVTICACIHMYTFVHAQVDLRALSTNLE